MMAFRKVIECGDDDVSQGCQSGAMAPKTAHSLAPKAVFAAPDNAASRIL